MLVLAIRVDAFALVLAVRGDVPTTLVVCDAAVNGAVFSRTI